MIDKYPMRVMAAVGLVWAWMLVVGVIHDHQKHPLSYYDETCHEGGKTFPCRITNYNPIWPWWEHE